MAAGTPAYPGGTNTYVKSHAATGNLIVSFSREPAKFMLPRYCQYREVTKDSGYYLKIATEQASRLVGGTVDEYVWPDGADRPQRNNGTEKFHYEDYRTERLDYDWQLGYKATNQADWDIRDTEAAFHAQQAMTGRTRQMVQQLENTANWDASHVINVTTIPNNTGNWEVSTTQRLDIKRSINYAWNIIRYATQNAVSRDDLVLVMNVVTAMRVGESQEIVDYIKGSPEAMGHVQGQKPQWSQYGLPDYLYGVEIVVEDAVMTTSVRGAATTVKSDVMSDGVAFLLARPGGLIAKAASGPSFSTAMCFILEEMTVEIRDNPDQRRVEGHVVDDVAAVVTAPVSGFYFTDVIT